MEIEKNIKLIITALLFREALILFNTRNDELEIEIKNEILTKWAERSLMGGNLALTAKVNS